MTMQEFVRGEDFAVGLWGDTIVISYSKSPTMATATAIDNAVNRAWPEERLMNLLVVIMPGSGTPEPAVRESMMASLKRNQYKTKALAYAVLGSGFANAAARAVVSGVLLLLRPPHPAKVFSTMNEAADWLRGLGRDSVRPSFFPRVDSLERFCTRTAQL